MLNDSFDLSLIKGFNCKMKQNQNIENHGISRYIIIGAIVFSLGILNYYALKRHVSGNSSKITDFTAPVEEKPESKFAAMFYSKDFKPKMLIIPEGFESPQAKNLIVVYGDLESENVKDALKFAQKEGLKPKVLNIKDNTKNELPQKNLTPLEQEVENLKSFAEIYGRDLLKLVYAKKNPSRDNYDDALFNQGASFITLIKNGKVADSIGTIVPSQAIAADIVNNSRSIAKDGKIVISLLTDFERIIFTGEEDLLNKIIQGTDGLIIRDLNRQGLLLPLSWKEFPDKKEFLKQLKLNAGMSPLYWSDKIKIYRFRTVEVSKNEN